MAALPGGAPVLNGLALRPWSEATLSVPAPLLTEAGFGVVLSEALPLTLLELVVDDGIGVDALFPTVWPYEDVLVEEAGFIL